MGNFRVPAGSQVGGNPKKKRRTNQNTASPVVQNQEMGPNDTSFARNSFNDSMVMMNQQAHGRQNTPGMSPGRGDSIGGPSSSPGLIIDRLGQRSPGMGPDGPNMGPGGMNTNGMDPRNMGPAGMDPRNMGHAGLDPRYMGPGGMDLRTMGPGGPRMDNRGIGPGGHGMDPRYMNFGGMGPYAMRPGMGPNGHHMGPESMNPGGQGMRHEGPNNIDRQGSNMTMGPGGPQLSMGQGGPHMMMGPGGQGMIMMGPGSRMMGGPMMGRNMAQGGPNGPYGYSSMAGAQGPMFMPNTGGPNGSMYGASGPGNMHGGDQMMSGHMGLNGPMGPPYTMSGPMHSPMHQPNTPGIPTGPGSHSPHGSGPSTPIGPLSGGCPSSNVGPLRPGSVGRPNSVGPSMGNNGMGPMNPGMNVPMGPSSHPNVMQPIQSPLPVLSNEKIYPPGQPKVFDSQNPSAPPIFPCGVCRKEVKEDDQAILCESSCNFWFHRICTGLTETAFHLLIQEIYAEWVCDRCITSTNIPLVKFKA